MTQYPSDRPTGGTKLNLSITVAIFLLMSLVLASADVAAESIATELGDQASANCAPSSQDTSRLGAIGCGEAILTIWQPAPGTTWQWQLQGTLDSSFEVDMYDIDLFDASRADIKSLKQAGRVVICYFSAGSAESWRPDIDRFRTGSKGLPLEGWPGEHWLDFRMHNVREIMLERLDLAVVKGCDGVEPDNVDGYDHNSGFDLSQSDQIEYLRFLSHEAHARGLSIGLKNALGLVDTLQAEFDWALNEECVSYNECRALRAFIDAGKAVFHTEYVKQPEMSRTRLRSVCSHPDVDGFSTLIKTPELGAWRQTCGD